MVCCVREAATGEYPIGRGQPNRKVFFSTNSLHAFYLLVSFQLTMKEQKQKEDDKKVLTDHFITTLPPLLNKVDRSFFNGFEFDRTICFSTLLMRINYSISCKFPCTSIMKSIRQHVVNVILMLI